MPAVCCSCWAEADHQPSLLFRPLAVSRAEYEALRRELNEAEEELRIIEERERRSTSSLSKLQMMSKSQTVGQHSC